MKMPSSIVIYFAPHFPTFTDPVDSSIFRRYLDVCDACVLEWADRWTAYEPDLETLFNQLSRGDIEWVVSKRLGRVLNRFDEAVQNALRGRNKRVLLERSPVEYPFIQEREVITLARSRRLNEATALYKSQLNTLVQNAIERDRAIVEMLRAVGPGRFFVFRGADHERYIRNLLAQERITATCITYEEPPLLRRLIGALTIGEDIADVDVQRVIYAMLHRQRDDYLEFVSLQNAAEEMSQGELELRLNSGID